MTLAASGLAIRRAGRPVLAGLGFALEPGQGLQVLGGNGSGKSTLLRILSGLLEPDSGNVTWYGEPLRDAPGYRATLRYLGHADGLDPDLSATENLLFSLRILGVQAGRAASKAGIGPAIPAECPTGDGDGAAIAAVLDCAGLGGVADRAVRTLSQGQRRRVALARLALLPGTLWLLDEPHAGLDAGAAARFESALARHLDTGGIAVIATHQPILGMPRLRALRLELP